MPRILTAKKVNQLRGILSNDQKRLKLIRLSLASKKNPQLQGVVFLKIAGVEAVLKIGAYENLSIANLLLLKKQHALSVSKREIYAKNYSLVFPEILFQGRIGGGQASICTYFKGVGCSELMEELEYRRQFPRRALTYKAETFLKLHPHITYEKMKRAFSEAEADFTVLRSKGKTISEDFYGKNNLIVLGTEPTTGKIVFGVIDQLFKGEEMRHLDAFKKLRLQQAKN